MAQKYRNKFEETAGLLLKKHCKYESEKVPYVIHKNYIPDFVGRNNKNKIDILVQGSDYKNKRLFKNVKIITFPRTKNISSTIIRKLAKKNVERK